MKELVEIGCNGLRLQFRVKITGTYKGKQWEYIDSPDEEGSQIWSIGENNDYWWSEGNRSCDYNRFQFLPEHLRDGNVAEHKCGNLIKIDRIDPIEDDPRIDAVVLDESK